MVTASDLLRSATVEELREAAAHEESMKWGHDREAVVTRTGTVCGCNWCADRALAAAALRAIAEGRERGAFERWAEVADQLSESRILREIARIDELDSEEDAELLRSLAGGEP